MVASTKSDDTLGTSRDRFVRARIDAALIVFRRAIERGELRSDIDPQIAFELVAGPLYLRTLITREPINKAFVETMVTTLLGGLAK